MHQVFYLCGSFFGTEKQDGAQIFDRKIVNALEACGISVEAIHWTRKRALRFPLWQTQLADTALWDRVAAARRDGAGIVLSHEAFFGLAHDVPIDALIVHNYMTCFSFPNQRWLEPYYRMGSRSYFERAFGNARDIVFLSYRDHCHAVADFPEIVARSHVLPPPPRETEVEPRRVDLVHLSGSEGWLPKRLSSLRQSERVAFARAGLSLEDFGDRPSPAFGLINDRFSVGFKLKLMQMLYIGDAIASLADIRDEMAALAPRYPHWQQVASIGEALDWFTSLRRDLGIERLSRDFATHSVRDRLPDWTGTGKRIADILAFGAATETQLLR